MTLRIGTRKSALALWQAQRVRDLLAARGEPCELVPMSTEGDRIVDHLTISLPRPRTYEMLSGDAFGTLRERIWRHIRKSA